MHQGEIETIAYASTIRPSLVPATLDDRIDAATRDAVQVFVWLVASSLVLRSACPLDDYLRISGYSSTVQNGACLAVIWLVPALWIVVEGGLRRGTYGMRRRGILFVLATGQRPGVLRCAVRLAVGILMMPLAPLSYIFAAFTTDQRTPADFICRVLVCKPEVADSDGHGSEEEPEAESQPERGQSLADVPAEEIKQR